MRLGWTIVLAVAGVPCEKVDMQPREGIQVDGRRR